MNSITKSILAIIIGAALVFAAFTVNYGDGFFRGLETIPKMFSCLILFFALLHFFTSISEAYPMAYKIVHDEDGYKPYQAKVFRFVFLFIPWWMPVEESYYDYEAQNLFGAKFDMIGSDEKEFKTKEKALAAIESYKESAIRERKYLFEKPGKKKTTYL
jgi:hypothetical protein